MAVKPSKPIKVPKNKMATPQKQLGGKITKPAKAKILKSKSGTVALSGDTGVITFKKSKKKNGRSRSIGLGVLSAADKKGLSGSASSALKYYNKHIRGKKG